MYYVFSTMSVSKESISKFLMRNRFHVKLRILSRYSNETENRFLAYPRRGEYILVCRYV